VYNNRMSVPLYLVDAFTDRPFAGNPAAVCLPAADRDAAWMQAAASEMNQAETAFLRPRPDGDWDLRWFTPAVEVELCGHATLASAPVLWETGRTPAANRVRFHTLSGVLSGSTGTHGIVLDFPNEAPAAVPIPAGLAEALGTTIVAAGQNRLDLFAEVADETTVRGLAPALERLDLFPVRGIVVTARADGGREYDFVSRFFAPRCGIAEDPVTGSAHCGLGPWWSRKLGKQVLVGYQASARGGTVRVTVAGDRCLLEGTAVTVWNGELV